jgi:hypothetical protein
VIPQTKDKIRRKTKGLLTQEGIGYKLFSLFLGWFSKYA